jgi:hypothetical protein
VTPLDKTLKRALKIDGLDYVITLTADALKITQKAHRLGIELKWADIVSGESALAVALNASLGKLDHEVARKPSKPARRRVSAKTAAVTASRITGKRAAPKRVR